MPERQTFNTHKLVKQILYSLFISLGTIAGIFAILSFRGISIDLSSFHPGWLLAAVVFIVMAWFIDAMRLLITARAWGKKIPYRNALTAVLSCYFMSAVTPSATGGSPAEMLVMNRSGFSWGEAGSLTAICGILYQVTLLILLCILIFFFGISFTLQGILLNLLYSFLVFYGTLMFLLFFFLYREDLVYRMVNWGIRFARKRFPKLKFTDEDVIDWVKNFFADFKSGFRILCREKPWYLLWNVIGYALYFIFFFSVGYFALLALGVHIPAAKVIAEQVPLYLIFGFIPTPGASGGVELSIGSVFVRFTGAERIGMFVLFWRTITFFLPLFTGAIAFFRVLGASLGKTPVKGIIPSLSDEKE